MKVKNAYIIHALFSSALDKLNQSPVPAKQCLELNAAIDELAAHREVLIRTRRNIVSKYAKKDEKGTMMVNTQTDEIIFPDAVIEEKCKKELDEILNDGLEVNLTNRIIVNGNDLWRPFELRLLSDIIDIKN